MFVKTKHFKSIVSKKFKNFDYQAPLTLIRSVLFVIQNKNI